jgi:hypothetical protein
VQKIIGLFLLPRGAGDEQFPMTIAEKHFDAGGSEQGL